MSTYKNQNSRIKTLDDGDDDHGAHAELAAVNELTRWL